MTVPTSRESDKFMLRLPDGMRDRIADLARANGRSMNSEIISRLEASFSTMKPPINFNLTPDLQGLRDHLVEIEKLIRDELLTRDDREDAN